MPPFFDERGDPTISPYTVLNIPTTATEPEIKKAYRTSMLQLHPDKLSPDLSEAEIAAVTEKFHNVKDAYEFLTSSQHLTARRLYQAKMASKRAEYERREAFLRRTNMNVGTTYTSTHQTTVRNRMPTAPDPRPSSSPRNHTRPSSYNVARTAKHSRGYTSDQGNARTSARTNNVVRGNKMSSSRDRQQQQSRRERVKTARMRAESAPCTRRQRHNYSENDVDDRARFEKKEQNTRDTTKRRSNVKSTGRNVQIHTDTRGRATTRRGPREDNRTDSRRHQQRQEQSRSRARSAPARCRAPEQRHNNSSNKNNNKHIPNEFICPLSKRIMKDPVVDPEGNAYEREAIERWLRVQSSSPITNEYLTVDMLRSSKELKSRIYKVAGKPRSKSQSRTSSRPKSRSTSPNRSSFVSGRVLVDSYLREISSKSKLSVSLDGMGICAFSYRKITFVIEVPIVPNSGFMVYSSFDAQSVDYSILSRKIDAWNKWLSNIKKASRVSHVMAGNKTVFSLKGSEKDMVKCEEFQKTLEYFVEMSLKLHNVLHPEEVKSIDNVCLTTSPVINH